MKKIFFALVITLMGVSAFGQNTDNLLKHYLAVKNALIDSDAKAAGAAITTFHEAVKSEADFSRKQDLLKATEKLSKAGSNLEKQRASFNDVSTLMWKLVEGADAVSSPVYYQYCPMKKAYWLSTHKEIKNPYYGASMLTCGKVTATKS
ncbi:hypothetical protein GCM10023091_04050 [Ravibacter arvi]|uniref:DUF3347 domain-containing protein n=1 Tax=Ravibacter arvi TaxID=2051041 RepID=A0ABP8LNN1_9BACT